VRFLIDECLSPALVKVAHEAGHEAYHVVHHGWGGLTDARLLTHLLDQDLILVTNNGSDFLALLGAVELHPGLIIILENVRREEQMACFGRALDVIRGQAELINRVVEVDGHRQVMVSDLPTS
jgi:predicted nuclease of predicted toxin-antitoxin system